MHARVAFFRLKAGSLEQVIEVVQSPAGLLEIFRAQPGFQAYELIETPLGLVSVSHWTSSKHASAASQVAASWAASHVGELVHLQQSDVGEVVLSVQAAAR